MKHAKSIVDTAVLIFLSSVFYSTTVQAVSCKIHYNYKKGTGSVSVYKVINQGASETINMSDINYVRNIKQTGNPHALFDFLPILGVFDIELGPDQRSPPVAGFVNKPRLEKVSCLGQSEQSSFVAGQAAAASTVTQTFKATTQMFKKMNVQAAGNIDSKLAEKAIKAAVQELNLWFTAVRIKQSRCRVNAITATAGTGVLSNNTWSGFVKQELKSSGVNDDIAKKWDDAFKAAVTAWAKFVTIPSLPWYPTFASFPLPVAPPIPNVPTPLGALLSSYAEEMTPAKLKSRINNAIGSGVSSGVKNAVNTFSDNIGGRFTNYLMSASVVNVLGTGSVPAVASGKAPAGPVIGGSCFSNGPFIAGKF